jgi:hypothetical protein
MTGHAMGAAQHRPSVPMRYQTFVDIGRPKVVCQSVALSHPHLTGIGFDPAVRAIFDDYVEVSVCLTDSIRPGFLCRSTAPG